MPRTQLVLLAAVAVAHAHEVALVGDLLDVGAGDDLAAQLGGQTVDQRPGAADDVAREARARAPDEREVARAGAGVDLLRLGRGARHGRPEHQVGIARQLAEPVGERPVVPVGEQPPASLGRRLARAGLGDTLVAGNGNPQARARAHEGHALAPAQREAERVQLGPAADEQPAVELEGREMARHGHGLDADVGDEPAGRRTGAAEDVRAEVQPVRIARLAADTPAEPLAALEHHHVAVAQIPGRREARDAATDHDRVAYRLAAEGVGGQVAESSGRAKTPARFAVLSTLPVWRARNCSSGG